MIREDERTEFKKTTGELNEAMVSVSAMLNKHKQGKLKSSRRILVFLNVSRLGSAIVSSSVAYKGCSICLLKGHQPLFLFC